MGLNAISTHLTKQFYEFDKLGRGCLLHEKPVTLEPPFTPFVGHFIDQSQLYDDGIEHTLLSKTISLFTKRKKSTNQLVAPEISFTPYPFTTTSKLFIFKLIIPKELHFTAAVTTEFLSMLTYCTSPVSFEIVANHKNIVIQITCREQYVSFLKAQVQSRFPGISLAEISDTASELLLPDSEIVAVDFGMKEEFMRPLHEVKGNDGDTFTSLFSILDNLAAMEQAVFQILFTGVKHPWEQSILRSVSIGDKPFFENAPEMLPMAREKVSTPLFATAIRLMAQARHVKNATQLLEKLSFALGHTSRSAGNMLIPLSEQNYTIEQRADDILLRQSRRTGMLLNARELATFVHIPSASLGSKKLFGTERKTKAAPAFTDGHPFVLGYNSHLGIERKVSISSAQRLKHLHIVGATGTGKSNLITNLILQDISLGNGVAVLDAHGDLIDGILNSIPERRIKDVVVIDPSDAEYPVAFNILSAHSEIEKDILSSDLVEAFKRHSTSWGDQMNSVFCNAIIAFLESSEGGTLPDLRRFLVEKQYREKCLQSVSDPSIVYYWEREYPLMKTTSIGPILTRLDTFLRPKAIRNMVAQKRGLDFEKLMDNKKIILVKLAQGLIGTENSYLLGSFVIAKIHQAAMARQAQAKEMRTDFFMYIDEFHNYITPSISSILSGARKYHLGLILAHQSMEQISKMDSEVAASVLANTGTRICFRVGDSDAKKFAEGFSFFQPADLQNLATGEAIMRIDKQENDFSLSTLPYNPEANSDNYKEQIIIHSRQTYATPKELVEQSIAVSLNIGESSSEPVTRFKKKDVGKVKQEEQETPEKIIELPVFQPAEQVPIPAVTISPVSDTSDAIKKLIQRKIETQHRQLQRVIKKEAETRGYKATIEAEMENINGRVDVLLEQGSMSIAVEISITTEAQWEVHNIKKCLAANYTLIISCSPEKNTLDRIKRQGIQELSAGELSRVLFFEPNALFAYLDQIKPKKKPKETIIKGYKVEVEFDQLPVDEIKQKKTSVARVVFDSLQPKKSDK
jgi:hypothetical protein